MFLGFCRSDVRAAVLRATKGRFMNAIKNATRVHLSSSRRAQMAAGTCMPTHLVLYLLNNIPFKRTLSLESHSFV
jgi:hypothetical protein